MCINDPLAFRESPEEFVLLYEAYLYGCSQIASYIKDGYLACIHKGFVRLLFNGPGSQLKSLFCSMKLTYTAVHITDYIKGGYLAFIHKGLVHLLLNGPGSQLNSLFCSVRLTYTVVHITGYIKGGYLACIHKGFVLLFNGPGVGRASTEDFV